jgi:hypothetical protein
MLRDCELDLRGSGNDSKVVSSGRYNTFKGPTVIGNFLNRLTQFVAQKMLSTTELRDPLYLVHFFSFVSHISVRFMNIF